MAIDGRSLPQSGQVRRLGSITLPFAVELGKAKLNPFDDELAKSHPGALSYRHLRSDV